MQTQHRDGDDREDGLELSRKLKGFCWNFLRKGKGGGYSNFHTHFFVQPYLDLRMVKMEKKIGSFGPKETHFHTGGNTFVGMERLYINKFSWQGKLTRHKINGMK